MSGGADRTHLVGERLRADAECLSPGRWSQTSRGLDRASSKRRISAPVAVSCFPWSTGASHYRIDGSLYRDNLQEPLDLLAARGGGLLWLPPNMTFLLSRPLTIHSGGIRVAGGGPSTVLALAEGTQGSAIIEVQPSGSERRGPVSLADIRVEGAGRNAVGIWLNGPQEVVRLERLQIVRAGGPGIVVEANGRPVTLDSIVVDSCLVGLRLSHSASVSAISSRFHASREVGVRADDSWNIRLTLCEVVDSAHPGVRLDRVEGFSAVGCRFMDNGWQQDAGPQVFVDAGSRALVFSRCRFEARSADPLATGTSHGPGILLLDAAGTLVLGCSFAGFDPPINIRKGTRRTTVLGNNIPAADILMPDSAGDTVRVGLDIEHPTIEET